MPFSGLPHICQERWTQAWRPRSPFPGKASAVRVLPTPAQPLLLPALRLEVLPAPPGKMRRGGPVSFSETKYKKEAPTGRNGPVEQGSRRPLTDSCAH